MNKNATPLILIIISLGMYFTYTKDKIEELKSIQIVNEQYQKVIDDSKNLIKRREEVLSIYNKIDPENRLKLEKMIPDNQDNVRLIIDLNGVASRNGMVIKNIKTASQKDNTPQSSSSGTRAVVLPGTYNTVSMTFDTSTNYPNFLKFLGDLQASLRIMEISKISLKANDNGNYDYNVEIKTFWLKE
jgi:Tfp pilus assembly protein PilO